MRRTVQIAGQLENLFGTLDENLKLLAVNALMQQDQTQAVPILQKILTDSGAPCWAPDPPSTGACQVK